MSKAKRHIHKYHRVDHTYAKVWACALPDCNHYMPQYMEKQVVGKKSICWSCGEAFILDENNMKQDTPICFECKHPSIELTDEEVNEIVKTPAKEIDFNKLMKS